MDGARGVWIEVVMPRDEKDVISILEIVKAGVWFSVSLLRDGDGVCCGMGDEERCRCGRGYDIEKRGHGKESTSIPRAGVLVR